MRFFSGLNRCLCFMVLFAFVVCAYNTEQTPDFHMGSVRAFAIETESVYLGGKVLGYDFKTDGVYVVSSNSVFTQTGPIDTLCKGQLKAGDVVKRINNTPVFDANGVEEIVNQENVYKNPVNVEFLRNGKSLNCQINPAYDVAAGKYKLGIWVKNKFSAVGTLTYVKKDGRYGALGHPIVALDGEGDLSVKSGSVFGCSVLGIKPATTGRAGEILGAIARKNEFGSLDKNCHYGVFGTLNKEQMEELKLTEIQVCKRKDIKTGKAQIFCALNGQDVKTYDIEIIKTNYQSVSSNKSLVFRLTDKALINSAGGIVQGMSGSPIVQNGKLVGAVTHVFLNDATKGFGIYIEWMLNN